MARTIQVARLPWRHGNFSTKVILTEEQSHHFPQDLSNGFITLTHTGCDLRLTTSGAELFTSVQIEKYRKPSPYYFHLIKIPWKIFGTLTFKQHDRLSLKKGHKMFRTLVRQFGRPIIRDGARSLPSAVMAEGGTSYKHLHLHFLLADTQRFGSPSTVSAQLTGLWENIGGGLSRIEPYDDKRDGVGYILKSEERPLVGSRIPFLQSDPERLKLSDALVARLQLSELTSNTAPLVY